MRHLLVAILLLIGAGAASAADMRMSYRPTPAQPEIWRYNRHSDVLPFARTGRAQSVYASGACWSDCQSFCTWNEAACLEVDAQGRCLKVTDRCDRMCQRDCRSRGGPLLSFELPWDGAVSGARPIKSAAVPLWATAAPAKLMLTGDAAFAHGDGP